MTVEFFCPYFSGSGHFLWNPGWAVHVSWGWRGTHHWRLGLRTWRD